MTLTTVFLLKIRREKLIPILSRRKLRGKIAKFGLDTLECRIIRSIASSSVSNSLGTRTKNGYCLLMSTLVVKIALRGYHIYQAVWEPTRWRSYAGEQYCPWNSVSRREQSPSSVEDCMLDKYLLACSFLPCCSALLILSVTARARLRRSGHSST